MPALAIGALVYRELSRRFGGAFIGGAERLAAGPVPHLGQAVPSPVRGVERELAVDRASLGHVPSLPRSGRPTPLFRAGSARRGTPGQHCPGVGECSHHSPLGCRSAGGAHYAWLSGLESPVRRHSAVVLGAVALGRRSSHWRDPVSAVPPAPLPDRRRRPSICSTVRRFR